MPVLVDLLVHNADVEDEEFLFVKKLGSAANKGNNSLMSTNIYAFQIFWNQRSRLFLKMSDMRIRYVLKYKQGDFNWGGRLCL